MNDNCFVIIRTCDNQETKGYINLFMVLLRACPTFEPTFESALISMIQNKQLTHSPVLALDIQKVADARKQNVDLS